MVDLPVGRTLTYKYTEDNDECAMLTVVARQGYKVKATFEASKSNLFAVST